MYSTLKSWKKKKKQDPEELSWMIKHSLRTAIKRGDPKAYGLLEYKKPDVVITNFNTKSEVVKIGDTFEFNFCITSKSHDTQNLLINYTMNYQGKNGATSLKTFKIADTTLGPLEKKKFRKRHPMRMMSTKTLYLGTHEITVYVNGEEQLKTSFELI